jgi:23S rRNA (cytidine1920-2'-O)/16S rRNA (cytidine1409-2'-O)-methyltransferase
MAKKQSRERLDVLLVERDLAESRAQAQRLVRAGLVRIADQIFDKPGTRVPIDAPIVVQARPRFVSRGGQKLEAALMRFELDVAGMVVADVGASTGGFTDCLLQSGASRVYAIDVGYGQLDWRLRGDERVIVMERTNARYLESLPEPVDMVTVDASFISLGLILPASVRWLLPDGQILALIKPQFEAGRHQVGKGGVVRDPQVHQAVLERVVRVAAELELGLCGLMASPLRGPAGNVEFLAWWRLGSGSGSGSLAAGPAIEVCLGGGRLEL